MNKTTKVLVGVILILVLSTIALAIQYDQKKLPFTATVKTFGTFGVYLDAACTDELTDLTTYNFDDLTTTPPLGFDGVNGETRMLTVWFENTGNQPIEITWTIIDGGTTFELGLATNHCFWDTEAGAIWNLEMQKLEGSVPWYHEDLGGEEAYLPLAREEIQQSTITLTLNPGNALAEGIGFTLVFTACEPVA